MNNEIVAEQPATATSRLIVALEKALEWICDNYKILVDALDEGERIHQLVRERKEQDELKAIRSGILYRFY